MSSNIKKWLFYPFEYVPEHKALLLGITSILFSGGLNILSLTRFDGVIDVHIGRTYASPLLFIGEGVINWLTFSILLFVAGLIFSPSSIRFIDVVSTQAMARWTLLIVSLSTLAIPHRDVNEYLLLNAVRTNSENTPSVYQFILYTLLVLIIILASIWMIILMYRAYSISCNLKGNKAIAIFIIILLVSEVISKYLISFLV